MSKAKLEDLFLLVILSEGQSAKTGASDDAVNLKVKKTYLKESTVWL